MTQLFCELLLRLGLVGFAGGNGYDLPPTRIKLADAPGMTSVHVSQILRDLRKNGLGILKSRRLIIPDVARLKAFYDFDPTYLYLRSSRAIAER